jgi:hypothetical protein
MHLFKTPKRTTSSRIPRILWSQFFYSNRILSNLLREPLCDAGCTYEECSPTDRFKFHTAMSAVHKSNKRSTLLNRRDRANVNSKPCLSTNKVDPNCFKKVNSLESSTSHCMLQT